MVRLHVATSEWTGCFKMINGHFIPNHPAATSSLLPAGLMLSAYARVGAVLGDKDLLERAVQAGNFIKKHLWDAEQKIILRSCYRGDDMEVQQM